MEKDTSKTKGGLHVKRHIDKENKAGASIPRESREPVKPITYSRPGDEYGMLGNMKGGMPLDINGHNVYASEHLYLCGYWSSNTVLHIQAQKYCLSKTSGAWAKRCTKSKYLKDARPDFIDFKYDWMVWVVWQKAKQNKSFQDVLLSTGDAPIFEVVKKDDFWAAWPDANGVLQGENRMGKILMMIRDCLRNNTEPTYDKDLLNEKGIYFLGERLVF